MAMKFTASQLRDLLQPSRCERRVYLLAAGVTPGPAGPYDQVLQRLGQRHELAHLQSFPDYVNIAAHPVSERAAATREAVAQRRPVIYQPWLTAKARLDGEDCDLVGEPDFLLKVPGGYAIRDVKIARRVVDEPHRVLRLQVQLYGWLFARTFGPPPARLEILTGAGEIAEVADDGGREALDVLAEEVSLRRSAAEPYSPVGWSKCTGCGFFTHCWPRAVAAQDVAIVMGVDQGLARALREEGVTTIAGLRARYTEADLSEVKKYFGRDGRKRVGEEAASILRMAEAMHRQQEILVRPPDLPAGTNFVVFDLEGLPPQLDDLQKIYLWGFKVCGAAPGPYLGVVAGFGPEGDRRGWEEFLERAAAVFAAHGDLPFLHWHAYEKTNLLKYIERFGDSRGTARRILNQLVDLLRVARNSIALPVPSYGLKVIEKYIGYGRSQEDYGGEWAMAKYIEAVETEDESLRRANVQAILDYNREDLEATWAVFQWLRAKGQA